MRNTVGRVARWALTGCIVSLFAASCSTAGIEAAPAVHPVGPAITFVAVGGTDFLGPGGFPDEDWADLVYRNYFGVAATLYDLSGRDETLSEALSDLAPEAVALHPAVAAVWLGAADVLDATPPTRYRAELTELVRLLRRGGATRVLLAGPPPMELYPGYPGCEADPQTCGLGATGVPPAANLQAVVDTDNTITDQVAAVQGVQVVPVTSALTRALSGAPSKQVATTQGLGLTAAGNALVARVFGSFLPTAKYPRPPRSGDGRRRKPDIASGEDQIRLIETVPPRRR